MVVQSVIFSLVCLIFRSVYCFSKMTVDVGLYVYLCNEDIVGFI